MPRLESRTKMQGKLIVFNFQYYEKGGKIEEREGSQVDCRVLKRLAKEKRLKYIIHQDLSISKVRSVLNAIRIKCGAILIIAFLCHGGFGYIRTGCGSVLPIQHIVDNFEKENLASEGTLAAEEMSVSDGTPAPEGILTAEENMAAEQILAAEETFTQEGMLAPEGVLAPEGTLTSNGMLVPEGMTAPAGKVPPEGMLAPEGTLAPEGMPAPEGMVFPEGILALEGSFATEATLPFEGTVASAATGNLGYRFCVFLFQSCRTYDDDIIQRHQQVQLPVDSVIVYATRPGERALR